MGACLSGGAGSQTPNATATSPDERFSCLIDARMRVKVSASVPGLVERVLVDRGARVAAGQVVVEMEASIERAQLAMAEARAANGETLASAESRLVAAERNFERVQRLRRANASALTDVRLDEVEMEARVAAANVRDARRNLEFAGLEAERARSALALRTIRAPVDGVVTERAMSPGEYRSEQAYFMTIAAIDPLHVEVFLPVSHYRDMALGRLAEVYPAAPVGGVRQARVSVIDPVIDAPSGTFGVRLELPNNDLAIPAGLRCEIRFLSR